MTEGCCEYIASEGMWFAFILSPLIDDQTCLEVTKSKSFVERETAQQWLEQELGI